MTIEALKLALEALEDTCFNSAARVRTASKIIKESLAQPKQEPHSWYSAQEDEWMTRKTRKEHERLNSYTHKVGKFDLALYTAPPQRTWVGLTDIDYAGLPLEQVGLVRWAEAKLKAKNFAQEKNT